MDISTDVYVHMCIYIYINIYTYTCIYIIYVCLCVCMCTDTSHNIRKYTRVGLCVSTCVKSEQEELTGFSMSHYANSFTTFLFS